MAWGFFFLTGMLNCAQIEYIYMKSGKISIHEWIKKEKKKLAFTKHQYYFHKDRPLCRLTKLLSIHVVDINLYIYHLFCNSFK